MTFAIRLPENATAEDIFSTSLLVEIVQWLVSVEYGYDFQTEGTPEGLIPLLAAAYAERDGESAEEHEWALREELGLGNP